MYSDLYGVQITRTTACDWVKKIMASSRSQDVFQRDIIWSVTICTHIHTHTHTHIYIYIYMINMSIRFAFQWCHMRLSKKSTRVPRWYWSLVWVIHWRTRMENPHDNVIKWKHFPRYWPFVRGIHRPPVNSPHKGQWRGALMFSLICAWINGWVNNREAGDLRRRRTYYDVTVMNNVQRCCDHIIMSQVFDKTLQNVIKP